jgi:hypothetical protein
MKRTPYENICTNCCKKAFGSELRGKSGFLAHSLPPGWYTAFVGTHSGTVCSESCVEAWVDYHLEIDGRAAAAP